MAKKTFQRTKELDDLLRAAGSANRQVALDASYQIAEALAEVYRKGVISGDILGNIFDVVELNGAPPEFPLDFLAPGTEKDHVAYSVPNHGYIPQKHSEGDYVTLPLYDIANSEGTNLKYLRNARWDVMGRLTEALEGGITKKLNDDGWHTLITAAADRNLVILDSDASSGQFTKRLVSLGKLVMRRNGGGNSTSNNRGKLTDLFLSPEAAEDIRAWNVEIVDEITRREIFVSEGDEALTRIFGINLHSLDELGEGQEYQLFYTNELGGSLPSGDVELAVGLDLSNRDSFVMIPGEIEVQTDPTMARMRRFEMWMVVSDLSFGCLDSRRALLLSM